MCDRVIGTVIYLFIIIVVGSLVLLVDELLGRFDFFERDALRRSSRLADTFRVGLTLRFALFIANWRYE